MQRLTEVVKVVPGFNKEVKFYKRITREGGAIETEPTTLDEIMQMEITMVLPPQPQSRRESELSRKLEAAYAEQMLPSGSAPARPKFTLHTLHTHITHSQTSNLCQDQVICV